jgi:hypothetical protein
MGKKFLVFLAGFLVFGISPALAGEPEVEVTCPSSVKVGSMINVTVKPYNWGSGSVTLSRYMAGIVANGSNTLGGAGLYGPFSKTLATAKTIPGGNPGTLSAFTVPVATAPNASGKVALVFIEFLTSNGKDMAGGDCMVSIVP